MTKNSHLGKAGHLAAMAELLLRGWNVAIPEVDVGDDIFVIDDLDGNVARIQVKTAGGELRDDGSLRAQYQLPARQLRTPTRLALYYVLVLRRGMGWEFLVIERKRLLELRREAERRSLSGASLPRRGRRTDASVDAVEDTVALTLVFRSEDVVGWEGTSFQPWRNNWEPFPVTATGPGARSPTPPR